MQNKSALYLLIAANVVSGFAQGISMLAIPWYFSDVLHASSTFGIIYGAATFLTLFWGLYVGTLVDRYPRKNIFLLISLAGTLIIGSVAFTGFYYGNLSTSLVGIVFCTTMFIYNIHYPTLYAFGQEITAKKDYGKINSILEIQGQSTSVMSGAFAAILITGVNQEFLANLGLNSILHFNIQPWKLHEIFLMDACTYVLAFTLILMIKYKPLVENKIDTGPVFKRLQQGISFLKEVPLIFHFGVGSFAIFAMLLIHIHQLMPIYISHHLHGSSVVYAGAEMLYAFGALFAGIGIRWIFKNTNTVKAIIIMMMISVAAFGLIAFTKSALLLIFICFILGLTNAGTRVLRITYLFNHVPNYLIGRAGSVFQTINIMIRFAFISLFSLTFFAKGSNITWAYFICGSFILVSAIPLFLYYKKLINLKPME